jgi:tRNA nucleotidyltransferase (CCA-adding enzyme)
MVGNADMSAAKNHSESIAEALRRMHPELEAVREAGGDPVYLVGGAVRDLLLGRGRADIDLVVEGDATALARSLGAEVTSHERFATAKVKLDGHELDIASARSESYPRPGALPVVEPAATLEEDLGRRDFTINAMAIPLRGEPRLIDPYGGQSDLVAKRLRVLHPRSFEDDPTRAIRAARYAARFDFELEQETATLLRRTDLDTVSADRREAELLRLAGEPSAPDAYRLLAEWGLIQLREGGVELAKRVGELLELPLWQLRAERNRVVHAAAMGEPGREVELAAADFSRPSEAAALITAYGAVEMVLARAHGAKWLDDYLEKWSQVKLEIDGNDLIAAGVTEGVALGRGLAEAKRRKLDGEIEGREQELEVALAVAREHDAVA